MQTVWLAPAPLPAALPRLHSDDLLHQLLARRGIQSTSEASAFLDPRPRHSPDSSGLPNIDAAVQRIGEGIRRGERIGIFGDYDADGITATAVMAHALRCAAPDPTLVQTALPTRAQGYGLNREAVERFADAGVTLLIAVDCGSGSHAEVALARAFGIDVVVLDHHQISGETPEGAIVVSAQLPGGEGYHDLCAAGVAFLTVAALAREGYQVDGSSGEPETALLDLVALGSIADMVPLSGMNRALVRDGLRQLGKGMRPGLAALARRAGVNLASASAEQIVFKVGPRLNAAGRMGDPAVTLELLLERDPLRANMLADEIEQLNERRRADSARVLREAELMIGLDKSLLDRKALILAGKRWPSGLLGPVAAQLVAQHRRPVVIFSDDGQHAHGSARSVPGLDITAAIRANGDLLERFGGHGQAAGLSLSSSAIPAFADALDAEIETAGIEVPYQPVLQLDAEIADDRLHLSTAELLQKLEPHGKGNEQPLLLIRDVSVRQYEAIGSDRSHLRFQLGVPGGTVKAIAFGMAARSRELVTARRIDIAAALKIDTWNGQRRLDIEIKDFRPAT